MPQIPMADSAYERTFGNFPPAILINLFREDAATAENGWALVSRPGLETSVTRGSGPINGIFSDPGTFDGDMFVVSDSTLYRGASSLGTILGTGPVKWAATPTAIVLTRGTYVYSYNGANLLPITLPNGEDIIGVAFIASLVVYAVSGEDVFYWNDINENERTIDSLAFASAELKNDSLLDVQEVLGQLILFGQTTIETWFPSGDEDLPFNRVNARLYAVGAKNANSVAKLGDQILFVANNGKVYRLSAGLDPISHPGIEEKISASTDCETFAFTWESHAFFCIRLDDETLAYDLSTSRWTVFTTNGHANWRVQCATNIGDTPYFGDDTSGIVRVFSDTFQDAGAALEAYFTAVQAIDGGILPIDRLEVRGSVGHTDPLEGDDAAPVMEMRPSNAGGHTFRDWREAPLGAQGNYRTRTMYRRVGTYDSPGFLAQFRITDQTPRRVSGVWVNEAGGGRSR